MALLLDGDYQKLSDRALEYEEDAAQRFFVFRSCALPERLYQVTTCDVLVVIPANYNQDGNDMFWTHPRLVRADGRPIPNTGDSGGDSRVYRGTEFCRWSRHWPAGSAGQWRAGRDDIIAIQRRIHWALSHPDNA
jgi:hypothetical protein